MHLFSFFRKYYHRDTISQLKQLERSQFFTYSQIRAVQFDKIRRLLEHSVTNVPYYRDMFKQIGASLDDFNSLDDLRNLPVLTKEIIRNNKSRLLAENIPIQQHISNATGGSTGEPLHFIQDHQYRIWADAARLRGWYGFAGCNCWETDCAVLWGATLDVKENFSVKDRFDDYVKTGEIRLNAFNLSNERKLHFARLCTWTRPKLVRGYFTAIKDFAYFLRDEKIAFPQVKGIILCAETVDDAIRAEIEDIFQAPAFNAYGGRELSLIAMECQHKNGLHEVSENNYVEFEPIQLRGYPDAGNLIVTNLNNYAMPFIRYRIGDIGVPSRSESCACGRGLPLIDRVIGRTTEVLSFVDGVKIAGEMFIHLMKDLPVRAYQFVQKADNRIVLRYPQDAKIDDALRSRIRDVYRNYLPPGVILDFEEVEKIEKTTTGKFRFVLREETQQ